MAGSRSSRGRQRPVWTQPQARAAGASCRRPSGAGGRRFIVDASYPHSALPSVAYLETGAQIGPSPASYATLFGSSGIRVNHFIRRGIFSQGTGYRTSYGVPSPLLNASSASTLVRTICSTSSAV